MLQRFYDPATGSVLVGRLARRLPVLGGSGVVVSGAMRV